MHVDAAKEFTGAPFKKICDKYGVDLYTSGTGHHQGNSIAERVIQTLMQSTLFMMYTANSPEREWTLAWEQAVYIYNRLPHKHFQELHCPLDKVNKSFPDYSRIKIFGCKAYVFNEAGGTRRINRLDYNRAHVRVFVGNTAQAHYKLLDRTTNQVTQDATIIKFDQSVNSVARLVHTPNLKSSLTMLDQEAVTEKPRPYQPGTDNLHVYKILNTCVYYDETEHKASGMLKVQTSEEGGNDDVWIKAIHLISTKPPMTSQGTRDDVWNSKPHITLLQEYIQREHQEMDLYHRVFSYTLRETTINKTK